MDDMKLLILEDNSDDADLMQLTLRRAGLHFKAKVVSSPEGFTDALDSFRPDVILSDHNLPGFASNQALQIAREKLPFVPFILVTGTVSEEFAASIIKEGADDYILKDRMTRLPAAIETALNQRKADKEIADYKYALDQAAIVAITDQKGIIIYANEKFCKISGYSVKELIGQDHRLINSGYHSKSYIKNLWVTIANGKTWRGEFHNKAKDGSFYWVDTTIIPFLNEKGKPYQYLSIRIDITERKEAEEGLRHSEIRLKEAQRIAHIGNWEIDFVKSIQTWSRELYEFFGVKKEIQPSTELFLSHIHPADADFAQKKVQEAFDSTNDSFFDFRFIGKDGVTRHCYSRWKFEFDKQGKPLRLYGIVQDITERKEMERQKDNFLSMASHELKTPVTTIKAYGQLAESMLEGKGDADTLSIIKRMGTQVNRLTALIGDLLDFTKIQNGQLMYEEQFFDFNELVKEVIEDAQKTSQTHTIKNNSATGANIFGNKNKLSQVFNNLISNAIKYSPTADSIVVSTELQGNGIELSVQDFGIGISRENQQNVFQQFYRVTGENQSTFPGMGIGLYICSEIIIRHGGKIWVESTPDIGSTFYAWLPFDHRDKKPSLLVTGNVSKEFAASIIKEGADDYILNDRTARLPGAIGVAANQRTADKKIADYKYALDQAAIVAI